LFYDAKKLWIATLATIVAALFFWAPAADAAGPDRARLARAAALVGPGDALVLAGPDGSILLAKHTEAPRIPASTLKLLTALAGFEILGESYRFPTDFFLDPEGNLTIKGYGDPMLVSEAVAAIASEVAAALPAKKTVGDLVLDDTFFAQPLTIPGVRDSLEPYDAPNGALCVNFNTVFFKTAPDGRLVSAEPQTPLLPMVIQRIRNAGMTRGRIVLADGNREGLRYAGHLFAYFLKNAGVTVQGRVRSGRIEPDRDRRLLRHRSAFALTAVVERLMTHSNNFTANQVLIAAGAKRYGPPGTLEKGVRALSAFAEETLGIRGLTLTEGSGISRQNRITAEGLLAVVDSFAPYRHLMVEENRIRTKTGTLAGIQTRAGYIEAASGLYRFVILINTPGRSADRILQELSAALP
jgi:D-alanyl-D-alanine carboxypeptidase/D-alanyl-D-alanine-endopeptidase (penicillin-binding protein 4)